MHADLYDDELDDVASALDAFDDTFRPPVIALALACRILAGRFYFR